MNQMPISTTAALKEAYLATRPALLRFLVARGASQEDAADLIQDLYLKLDRTVGATVNDPRAYLYRMADNLFLDRSRAAMRRIRRDEEWTGLQSDGNLERDLRPSADQILVERERLAAVTTVLDALPPRTSEVFRRFRLNGETQKLIAADLGISVSAVEKHLQRTYRALLAIRADLDAEHYPSRRLSLRDGNGHE